MDIENVESVIPGVIRKVNPDGTISVRPVVRKIEPNGVFDIVNPEIPNVPLMKIGGANAEISFPSKVGDQVLLVSMSRDISEWKKSNDDDIVPRACTGMNLNTIVAVPFVKFSSNGAAKIRVNESGDIEFSPSDGRRVISHADFFCDGKIMSVGSILTSADVAAKCTQLPDGDITDLPVAFHLSTHIHETAVGPSSPPTPDPPTE